MLTIIVDIGGWGGIRTHETRERLPVFKTGPFNHSGTHPSQGYKEFSSFLRPSKTAEYHVTLEKKGIRNRRRHKDVV